MRFALALVFAFVVVSRQQLQRTRLMPWMTSYSSYINKYQPLYYDSDVVHHDVPFFRYSRPIRPTPSYLYSSQNGDLALSEGSRENAVEASDEFLDTQGRINGFSNQDAQARFFYGTTINNPFYKTATFTISSTVTTLGSIVLCVPSNNLAAVPSPTCAGRRKRENEDPEDQQFPIAPTETHKLAPTVLLSSDEDHHQLMIPADNRHNLLSSKGEGATAVQAVSSQQQEDDEQPNHYREKRFFGNGIAASTTVTRYSFVGATLTSTVILDTTAENVAVCLPAGYVVCAQ